MRCQATTKDGRPCGRHAVAGLTVCAAHAERPELTNTDNDGCFGSIAEPGALRPLLPKPKADTSSAPAGSPPAPQDAGAYAPGVGEEELATLAEMRRLGADLAEELALARLQLLRALERSRDETREACDGKRCPLGLVDKRLELVAKVAERCGRIAEGLEVRVTDPAAIDHVLTIIRKHIHDPDALRALAEELGGG